jgi:hypothetical protein
MTAARPGRIGQRFRVAILHEQARLTVHLRFRYAINIERHHRTAGRHRF